MKSDSLSGQFPGVERTCVGQRTVRLSLDVTASLPIRIVAKAVDVSRVLHPLDHLKQTPNLIDFFTMEDAIAIIITLLLQLLKPSFAFNKLNICSTERTVLW